MKWRNHALMAGSIAVILDLYPVEIFFCVAGANLPDQMETIGKFRLVRHRSWTHELLLWLAPLLILQLFPDFLPVIPRVFSLSSPNQAMYKIFLFRTWVLFLPGVLHLCGDLLTPAGIRVGKRKVSLGLFRTGQFLEYLVAIFFVLLAVVHKMNWMPSIFGAH